MIPRTIALIQGAYYILTGLWPLLHMPSFLSVTGPKDDLWLVRTVGTLVIVIGAALVTAAVRSGFPAAIWILGAGSAGGIAAIELYYGLTGQIWPVYLIDAVIEIILALGWITAPFLRPASERVDLRRGPDERPHPFPL